MEGRPERLADYFLVVGLGQNVSRFELFPSEDVDVETAAPDPITDIAVVFKRHESAPKGYHCIEKTPGGHVANLNSGTLFGGAIHLAYRRGRDKAPITEISVFHTSTKQPHPPPLGHETIAFSVSGRPADLNKGGTPTYITVKRGVLYGHNTAIIDLCIIMPGRGEEVPPGYKQLQMDLNKGLVTPSVFLCYKTGQVRPPSVPHTPEIISRFPETDYTDFSLPESVPLFCLPSGVSVEHWDRRAPFPLPSFSTFALTNERGQCMYGAVVAFYEQMMENDVTEDMRSSLGVGPEAVLHVTKCICLLSHWPFFAAFRAFLSSLYRLSVSRNTIPLERYIGHLMLDAPFPTMERPRVQLFIGCEDIIFSLPVQTPLPLSVSTHWSLLVTLDPPTLLSLHSLLISEQKLVLTSSRPALLTAIGEALRSVLFPFSWQCTYIPMCPLAFSNYMQAPVPFIIGVDSQYFSVFEKPSDVTVVDLDTCTITLSSEAKELLDQKPLPSKPLRHLMQDLKTLAAEVADLNPGIGFAVEVTPIESDLSYKADLEQIDVKIREAFLRFHATILRDYRMCLRPLLSAPSERSRDASLLFDQQLFLQHVPVAEWPFFRHLFDTQLFCVFVEQRSFVHAESTALAFFDECTEKLKMDVSAKLLDVKEDVSRRSDLPTVVAIPPDAAGLIPNQTYTYPVFPSLDLTLISSRCGTGMRMNRSPSVCSLLPGSPMVARRTRAEKHRDKLTLEQAKKSDVMWSHVLLTHICSLWYVLLPAHLGTQWNKVGVLSQALELLDNMRKTNILPRDEVCYRVLMEQCVKIGRPALAVKVYNEMVKAGIQPNAVTYGFYNKVVMEGYWPSRQRRWKVLKIVVTTCFYLLRFRRRSDEWGNEDFGDADFRILSRTASVSSRKSLSALDVGLGEGDPAEEEPLSSLQTRKTSGGSQQLQTGHVYKLSTGMAPGAGDYVVKGNSSYMVDKSPRWSAYLQEDHTPSNNDNTHSIITDGLKSSTTYTSSYQGSTIRRMSLVDQPAPSLSPGLHLELTSCSQCPHCHRLLYDEVIMANWSESEADYKTRCPYCGFFLVASLTIVKKQRLPFSGENTDQKKKNDVSIAEEEEGEGEGEEGEKGGDEVGGKGFGGVESADNGRPSSPSQEEMSNWTMSLDRRNPLSPQRTQKRNSWEYGEDHLQHSHADHTHHHTDHTHLPTDHAHSHIDSTHLRAKSDIVTVMQEAVDGASYTVNNGTSDPNDGRGGGGGGGGGEGEGGGRGRENNVVVSVHKPPLPPCVKKQQRQQQQTRKQQSKQVQEVVIGGGEGDETDVGARQAIAQMRARGHKRASSAPIHYQAPIPVANVPPALHIGTGGKEEEGGERRRGRGSEVGTGVREHECPPIVVPYLSPVVLRKELESLITQDGSDVLGRGELVTSSPSVYWNLVWYFSRLQLPTYLPLLTLWSFTQSNRDLRKHSVQMKVDLMWDKRFPDTPDPLYLMWLGKVPCVMQLPSSPGLTRTDSSAQLQSLVAKTQWGQLTPLLTNLLEDRLQHRTSDLPQQKTRAGPYRSVYREALFFKAAILGTIDVDQFDREFRQAVQRLSRSLYSLLSPHDHPPSPRARHCRTDFGPLQVT